MSSGSAATSSAIGSGVSESGQPFFRRRALGAWLKYGLAVVALGSLYAGMFLQYLWWDLAEWLHNLSLICVLAILVFSVNALFRRRLKELAVFFATLVVAFLPVFGVTGPSDWLYAEGFRIHALPLESYLSGCKLVDFIEKGTRQTVGRCESHGLNGGYAAVFYDTTGELQLPASQRTSEWKAAMWHFSPHAVLIGKDGRARKLFGSFYEIVISSSEFDGDDERH